MTAGFLCWGYIERLDTSCRLATVLKEDEKNPKCKHFLSAIYINSSWRSNILPNHCLTLTAMLRIRYALKTMLRPRSIVMSCRGHEIVKWKDESPWSISRGFSQPEEQLDTHHCGKFLLTLGKKKFWIFELEEIGETEGENLRSSG